MDAEPTFWKKNAMGPFNGVGIVIMSMALIVYGVARQPDPYVHDPNLAGHFSNARGLIDASPFFGIGLLFLMAYSRVRIEFATGRVIRTYGFLPVILRKEYDLVNAKRVDLDGWRGRSGVSLSAKLIFENGKSVALSHGDGQLGIEDVLGLSEKLHLPVQPTERLLKLKSEWVQKLLADGKIGVAPDVR